MNMLHELIHSLTPHEKGYFKKNASGSANYLKLFYAIDAQPVYDEAALKKKFRGKKFLNQLSVAKNYLYESILKTLAAFHTEKYTEQKVFNLYVQAQLLVDKGLYHQSLRLLKRANEICETHDLTGLRFQLHLLERKLFLLEATDKKSDLPVEHLIAISEKIAGNIADYSRLLTLHYRQIALTHDSFLIKNEERINKHRAIFEEAQNITPTTRTAAMLQADVRINYYSAIADYENSYREIADALQQLNANRKVKINDQISTVILYDLILTDALRTGKFKEFEKRLHEFKKIEPQSEPVKISATLSYARFALVYYDMKGDRKKLMDLANETEIAIKKFGAKIRKDLSLAVIIAFCSAMLEYGEYQRALDWVGLYQQQPKFDRYFDFQSFILIFRLIAHHELGNRVYVTNVLNNLRYFLKKNKQQSPFEEIVLLSFKQLSGISDKQKLNDKLNKNIADIKTYSEKFPAASNNVVFPIFIAFLQSKIANKKYHVFLASKK